MESFLNLFNKPMELQFVKSAILNKLEDEKCELLHVGGCNAKATVQFFRVVRSVFNTYLVAHLIPFLLFKLKRVKKNPGLEIKKFVVGLLKSLLNCGLNGTITCRLICLFTKYLGFRSRFTGLTPGLGGVALLFESPARQVEITLVCMTKAFETTYNMMRRRGYAVKMPYGNLLINGAAFSIISYAFLSHHSTIKESYNYFLNLFFKDI